LSDQIEVKITFKGTNNSLKVQKNYFCNGIKKSVKEISVDVNYLNKIT
jgi:hypothetical protein